MNAAECELFEAICSALAEADTTISAVRAGRTSGISAEHLPNIFWISHDEAARTIDVTSQLNCQNSNSSLAQNVGMNDRMLRFRCLTSLFYNTDTLYVTGKAKSTHGDIGSQIYVSDKGFVAIYAV